MKFSSREKCSPKICLSLTSVTTNKWVYEAQLCFQEFREKFRGVAILEANFLRKLSYVLKLFREIGSIKRKSGSRALTKRTPETVENVRIFELIFFELQLRNIRTCCRNLLTSLILKDIFSMTTQQPKQV